MRYTTVIDISEFPAIYRSPSVSKLYIHMALKAGYQAENRDLYTKSIRATAADTGLSVSAVRHALAVLERTRLIQRSGPAWLVKKFVEEVIYDQREKTKKTRKTSSTPANDRERQQTELESRLDAERRQREALFAAGKNPWMNYYETKERAARAGDVDAIEWCRKNRSEYERQAQAIKNQSNKK